MSGEEGKTVQREEGGEARKAPNRAPPAHANAHGPEVKVAFIELLRQLGNVSQAAKEAGIGRRTAYDWREEDEAFRAAWEDAEAEAADALEAEARRRAVEGVESYVISGGRIVRHDDEDDPRFGEPVMKTEYSDKLLETLLRAHKPEKYRDRRHVEHAGGVAVGVAGLLNMDDESDDEEGDDDGA